MAGSITANSSQGSTAPTAIIQPGGTVSFAGTYTSSPTNPVFVTQAPSITASGTGVTVGTPVTSATTASATVTFSDAGVFAVTFVGTSVDSSASPAITAHQDYVWTVFVSPSRGARLGGGLFPVVAPHWVAQRL